MIHTSKSDPLETLDSKKAEPERDKPKQAFAVLRLKVQYPRFLREEARKIAEETILKPLHSRMRAFGYSEKIINGTTIENITIGGNGTMYFDVVSDYDSESGFDVAKAREEGTADHDLPKVQGRIYSWIAGGFVRAFSRGHRVSGITATNVVSKTVHEMTPIAQARLNEATDEFMSRGMRQ